MHNLVTSRTDNEKYEKSKTRDNEQVSVEILPHINSMLNYFKSINEMVRLPNIAIVTDNIRPQLLFEESAVSLFPRVIK